MSTTDLANIATNYLQVLVHEDDQRFVDLVGANALIIDRRRGRISGKEAILQHAHDFKVWLEDRNAKAQFLRLTATSKRVGCEYMLNMEHQGEYISLPVATVLTHNAETGGVEIHVYHTMWPFNRYLSKLPALFPPEHEPEGEHTDVIEDYFHALNEGSTDKILETLEADIYFRESSGPPYVHWGHKPVAHYFEQELFSKGSPMIKGDTITDDGKCVVMEFTVFGWEGKEWPPEDHQRGLAAYERSKYGKICAIRIYDEIAFT